jgi:hypothetical protein
VNLFTKSKQLTGKTQGLNQSQPSSLGKKNQRDVLNRCRSNRDGWIHAGPQNSNPQAARCSLMHSLTQYHFPGIFSSKEDSGHLVDAQGCLNSGSMISLLGSF